MKSTGDTYKATYSFSFPPPINYLKQLSIPVLISYGTRDHTAPFIDYLRIEIIRLKKQNFTFIPYLGVEHNFFKFKSTGKIDYDKFNWDKVALDWYHWLLKK
ncbi:MAG: dienelactone hydrolase family protein [Chitinophagaceae bacterium]